MNANFARSELTADELRLMEASEWILHLQGADVDEKTTAQWLEWCQADKQNLSAFESVRALWHTFDDKRLETSLSLSLPGRNASGSSLNSSSNEGGRKRTLWALAAVLVLAIGGAAWYLALPANPALHTQTLNTAVASLSRQTLPDGSTVELGARSAVRVDLTKERRNVRLDDGEAFFQVAKDPERPFIVQAGDLKVIAIGTAFNVRKAQERIVVTVREGAVRVESSGASPTLSRRGDPDGQVRADAGHQVIYSTLQHSLTLKKVEPVASVTTKPMAWQVGRLEFANEPLGSVIIDINRYAPRPIVVADERVAQLPFTGTVRSDAIDDWLRGLKDVFPVEVVNRDEQGVLLVYRRSTP